MTIEVRYTCAGCDRLDAPCTVPARGAEDVIVWLRQTMLAISEDHARYSPFCLATTFDLKVPMHEATTRVGSVRPQ